MFGNKKISGNLTKLLQCYQEALKPRLDLPKIHQRYLPEIEFRCGGTLRYNRQICKVIIICPEGELCKYPKLKSIGYCPLKLTIQNGVMSSSGTRYSWDTYAFPFYFPSEDYVMKCPKSVSDFELTDIEHDTFRCLRGSCPNWSYVPKKRK